MYVNKLHIKLTILNHNVYLVMKIVWLETKINQN